MEKLPLILAFHVYYNSAKIDVELDQHEDELLALLSKMIFSILQFISKTLKLRKKNVIFYITIDI